jgi:hypothetical protein
VPLSDFSEDFFTQSREGAKKEPKQEILHPNHGLLFFERTTALHTATKALLTLRLGAFA